MPMTTKSSASARTLIVEFGSYGRAPLVEQATLADMAERYAKEG